MKYEKRINYEICHLELVSWSTHMIEPLQDSINRFRNKFRVTKKRGFTLAEVLITLGIIGVVAALTLPNLIKNYNAKVKETQIKVITSKLYQAAEQMQIKGALIYRYSSTLDYISEMQKEMKILKVCDGDHLSDCWGYNKVTTRKNVPAYSVSNAKDAKTAFDKTFDDGSDFAESAGIILANGVSMILSYDKKCKLFDPDTRYAPEETSACMIGVYDINGRKGPNKFGEDVIGFNIGRFGGSCTIEIGSTCFTSTPFKPKPLTHDECIRLKDKLGITYCMDHDRDYWGGAVKTCGHKSRMPNSGKFKPIITSLYGVNNLPNGYYSSSSESTDISYNPNSEAAKVLGLTPKYFIWMNNESCNPSGNYVYASDIMINSNQYQTQGYTNTRAASIPYAICSE